MKRDVHPPSGATAIPSGLVVVGVALVKALQANRTAMTLTALALVAFLLLLYYRRLVQTLLTLVPVLVAVGLSSVVVFATGLELSPLTSVAGPLVIAVGTEFAVLIMSRYVEERERGRSREDAVDVGIVRIGRAFVASGLTLVGGFAVIALSAFPLLRDFGMIVALNTLVALIVALVVLPPLLVWADRHPRIGGFSPGIDLDHRAEHDADRELPLPPAPRPLAERRFTARR
jgi:predicted RND superfamily exporter protein